MSIKVKDMDQVEGWTGGGTLGVGIHNVRITRATETVSTGGHDQVVVEYTALDGGASIRDWITFARGGDGQIKQGSLARARSLLDAVMIEPQGGDWEFPVAQLEGKKLQITVQEEPKWDDPEQTVLKVFAVDVENATTDPQPDTRDLPGDKVPVADADNLPF